MRGWGTTLDWLCAREGPSQLNLQLWSLGVNLELAGVAPNHCFGSETKAWVENRALKAVCVLNQETQV